MIINSTIAMDKTHWVVNKLNNHKFGYKHKS